MAEQSPKIASLVLHALNEMTELSIAFKAYQALERLISPEYEHEQDGEVLPTRSELGSLLHTLNAEMQRQISALADTLSLLQARADMKLPTATP